MPTIHPPEDLEQYLEAEVQRGRFASPDEAVAEALLLLRRTEQETKSQKESLTPDEVNQRLLEVGLLSRIPGRLDPATCEEFVPIVVQGEPLSETVIRERR